jgi:hypothetical protein
MIRRVRLAAIAIFAAALAAGAIAGAQEFVPPPFPALDAQIAAQAERDLDRLADQRRALNLSTAHSPFDPNAAFATDLARIDLDARSRDLLVDLQRQNMDRQRASIAEAAGLPNRRIAATSALVIRNPEALALPALPRGQYYAELDGRIVRVDAMSELPIEVLRPAWPDAAAAPDPARALEPRIVDGK